MIQPPRTYLHYTFLLICLLGFLAGCNDSPRPYSKGLSAMKKKQYEEAVSYFAELTTKDKRWYDSGLVKTEACFTQMALLNQWKAALKMHSRVRENEERDEAFREGIAAYTRLMAQQGKSDSALHAFEENREKLLKSTDTAWLNKQIALLEDSLFTGNWQGEGSLKTQEIAFQRQGPHLNGISTKTAFGWTKGSIIYKSLTYKGNKLWGINPKIFTTYRFTGNTATSYSKKGTLALIHRDTIIIDYESLGSSSRFHRMGKK